jgi:hypothetical protein
MGVPNATAPMDRPGIISIGSIVADAPCFEIPSDLFLSAPREVLILSTTRKRNEAIARARNREVILAPDYGAHRNTALTPALVSRESTFLPMMYHCLWDLRVYSRPRRTAPSSADIFLSKVSVMAPSER